MIEEAHVNNLKMRLAALEEELSKAGAGGKHARLRTLAGDHAKVKKLLEKATECFRIKKELDNDQTLLNTTEDADLKEMAKEEIAQLEEKLLVVEKEFIITLLPTDPNDKRDTIMEIRAGTGGDEAALFASDLYRMYCRFAEKKGWKIEPVDASPSEIGGYKEIIFMLKGKDVYRCFKYESGVHRVQRVPVTEASGRIHTSAATVAVLPAAQEEDNIEIRTEDIRIDIFCSSGPGGQSVNTTYSAVRVTHLPTKIVVQSQDERSQRQNKEKAMAVLRARLLDQRKQEEARQLGDKRRSQIGSGDRSERIRTYNFPQNRVTDHRVNLTLYSLDRVIEGELDSIVESLQEHDIQEKLRAFQQSEVGRDVLVSLKPPAK